VGEESGELRSVLSHAERLAALLFVHELTPPSDNEAGAVWLVGRAAEVERYLEIVAEDRAKGTLDDRAALATVQRYLDAMHAGLVTIVGATSPSCCDPTPRSRRGRRR
jgi:hypothetical protein